VSSTLGHFLQKEHLLSVITPSENTDFFKGLLTGFWEHEEDLDKHCNAEYSKDLNQRGSLAILRYMFSIEYF
jgi:hypothetical protein